MKLITNLAILWAAVWLASGQSVTSENDVSAQNSQGNRTRKEPVKPKRKRQCNMLDLEPEEYQFLPNRTIRIVDGDLTLWNANFTLNVTDRQQIDGWDAAEKSIYAMEYLNGFPIKLCYPLSQRIIECQKWGIEKEEFELLPGKRLYNKAHQEILGPHEYFIVREGVAAVCVDKAGCVSTGDPYHIHLVMYIVSVIFLIITVVLHLFIPTINYDAKPLLCHLVSLTFLFMGLALTKLLREEKFSTPWICNFCFISIQYFGLSTFLWLNVVAFDLWWKLTKLRPGSSDFSRSGLSSAFAQRFRMYCLYANGIPLLLVILAQIVAADESIQVSLGMHMKLFVRCWFNDYVSATVFFFGPSIVAHVLNLVFFVWTVVSLCCHINRNPQTNSTLNKKLFIIFVKLFVVMGVFWMFETISYYFPGDRCSTPWFIPDLINASQGVFMFVIYIVRPSTWQKMQKRFPALKRMPLCGSGGASSNTSSSAMSAGEKAKQAAAVLQPKIPAKRDGMEKPILMQGSPNLQTTEKTRDAK